MPNKVVFEVAALADALRRAAAVAPTKGVAFSQAAGIILAVGADEVVIKSTDTVTRFATWLTPEEVTGDPVVWRVPSRLFAEVIGKLKTTRNKTLTLEQDGMTLRLMHGMTRATFMMMDPVDYPDWSPFDPDNMSMVEGLAGAAAAVQWAASKGTDVPFTGVHFDGEKAIATDKYRFAVMPCKVTLDQPMTVPASALTTVLKNNDSVLIRAEETRLCLMTDDYTQISTAVYGVPYPPIQKVMRREWPHMVKVEKRELADTLDLVCSMIQSDRQPTLVLILGKGQIAAMLSNTQMGLLGNVIETPGQLDMKFRHEIRFKPEILTGALEGCTSETVTLGFDPSNSMLPFYINGGGIEYWLAPRQKMDEVEQ